jgi:hypothetical protein
MYLNGVSIGRMAFIGKLGEKVIKRRLERW